MPRTHNRTLKRGEVRKVDKKIYQELVIIRKELQAIRSSMEPKNVTVNFEIKPVEVMAKDLVGILKNVIDQATSESELNYIRELSESLALKLFHQLHKGDTGE